MQVVAATSQGAPRASTCSSSIKGLKAGFSSRTVNVLECEVRPDAYLLTFQVNTKLAWRHISAVTESDSTPLCRDLRYTEDIRLSQEAGCNAFRLSIEWARVEPKQGEIDMSAVDR